MKKIFTVFLSLLLAFSLAACKNTEVEPEPAEPTEQTAAEPASEPAEAPTAEPTEEPAPAPTEEPEILDEHDSGCSAISSSRRTRTA